MIHSLGLMAVSQIKSRHHLVGGLFASGIVLFSGSLYALVLTENKVRFDTRVIVIYFTIETWNDNTIWWCFFYCWVCNFMFVTLLHCPVGWLWQQSVWFKCFTERFIELVIQ